MMNRLLSLLLVASLALPPAPLVVAHRHDFRPVDPIVATNALAPEPLFEHHRALGAQQAAHGIWPQLTQDHPVVLGTADGRWIRGIVHALDQGRGTVSLTGARFAAQDFAADDRGLVTLPVDVSLRIVDGADGVLTLDAYIQRLPASERERFRALFYGGQGDYAAELTRLWTASRAAAQALPNSTDKTLVLELLDARSEKEALALLKATAIADLPTEIIRAARRVNATTLIALQEEIKALQDIPAQSAEGFVRAHRYTIPGDRIEDTLRGRWGTTEPDVVVIGAGPTGIVQALLFSLFGFRVLLVDKGGVLATWSDKLNWSVHGLRSPGIRNDATFALFPHLERLFGFKDHLPFYRLLAEHARAAVETFSGLLGFADSGIAEDTRALHPTEKIPDVLAHSSTRGELVFQLLRLLRYAVDHDNVVVLEDTPVTRYMLEPSGRWSVTLRTDRPTSPDLTLQTTHPPHHATGFSGARGEFARIPPIFETWDRQRTHRLVRDSFEMDQPSTLAAFAHADKTPLIVTAALVGHPAYAEYVRRLPAGTAVVVVGDQESAIKSLVALNGLNPGLRLVNIVKRYPKETPRHFTALQNRRGHVEDFLRNSDVNGPDRLTEDQRRASQVSPQSAKDYQSLIDRGVLTVRQLNGVEFGEKTDPAFYRDIRGPWVIATGYDSPEERFEKDALHAGLFKEGTLRLEDTLKAIPAEDGWPLSFGRRDRAENPTYTGPFLRVIAIAFITGSFGFAWNHAYANARRLFVRHRAGPAQPLAVRTDGQPRPLTAEQAELYDRLYHVFHDPALYALEPARARPTVIHEASAFPKARQDDLKARFPLDVVTFAPETDPARKGHLKYALNDEAYLEVIPGLRDALANPGHFVDALADRLVNTAEVSADFAVRLAALKTWLAEHPDLAIHDVIVRPVDVDGIVVLDAADYDTLSATRSSIRRVQHVFAPPSERFQGEPLIVDVLQRAFTAILLTLRAPQNVWARLHSPTESRRLADFLAAPLAGYPTGPIDAMFDWSKALGDLAPGRSAYLVVFRSRRNVDARDPESTKARRLNALDQAAYDEALTSGGLLHYFRGALTPEGDCLSLCVWESPRDAHRAARLSQHIAAVRSALTAYESFRLERYIIRNDNGRIVFEPILSHRLQLARWIVRRAVGPDAVLDALIQSAHPLRDALRVWIYRAELRADYRAIHSGLYPPGGAWPDDLTARQTAQRAFLDRLDAENATHRSLPIRLIDSALKQALLPFLIETPRQPDNYVRNVIYGDPRYNFKKYVQAFDGPTRQHNHGDLAARLRLLRGRVRETPYERLPAPAGTDPTLFYFVPGVAHALQPGVLDTLIAGDQSFHIVEGHGLLEETYYGRGREMVTAVRATLDAERAGVTQPWISRVESPERLVRNLDQTFFDEGVVELTEGQIPVLLATLRPVLGAVAFTRGPDARALRTIDELRRVLEEHHPRVWRTREGAWLLDTTAEALEKRITLAIPHPALGRDREFVWRAGMTLHDIVQLFDDELADWIRAGSGLLSLAYFHRNGFRQRGALSDIPVHWQDRLELILDDELREVLDHATPTVARRSKNVAGLHLIRRMG